MSFFGDVGGAIGGFSGGLPGFLLGRSIGGGRNPFSPSPFDTAYKPQQYLNGPMSDSASALQRRLNSMQMPGHIAAPDEIKGYNAKDYSGSLPEYDQVRQQTSQNLNAQTQSNQDALDRKFAANGMSNSGAAVKALQVNNQQAGENRAQAMNNIGFQEAGTRRQLQQGEENKAFQSGEQAKYYNAQAKTHNSEYNNQLDFQNNQFQFDANSKIAGLDLAFRQAQQQSADSEFNAAMESYRAQHTGGLLGSGGILGTGIG